jgi:hypothetical protein
MIQSDALTADRNSSEGIGQRSHGDFIRAVRATSEPMMQLYEIIRMPSVDDPFGKEWIKRQTLSMSQSIDNLN